MSKRALDLLKSLDLIGKGSKPANLMRMADVDLEKAMDSYFSARLAEMDDDRAREASASGFAALMTSTSFRSDLKAVLPSALVYEKVFIDDPMLHEANRKNRYTNDKTSIMSRPAKLDRKSIGAQLQYLTELEPLITNGILSILPVSRQHCAKEGIPILYSEDNFDSEIPPHIRSFVYESARISEVVRTDNGMVILATAPEKPVRTISVHFEQDEFERPGKCFFLSQIQATKHVGDRIYFEQNCDPNIPVDQKEYQAWLRNATNNAVLTRLEDASFEMALAQKLNACYLTDSAFEAKLLALSSEKTLPADSRSSAVNFLNANATFLNIQSARHVANVRTDSPLLFEKFHASLLDISSQLTGETDHFEDKARQLYVKEIDPKVEAINAQLSNTKTQAIVSGLLAASPFSLALLNLLDVPFGITVAAVCAAMMPAVVQSVAGTLPAVAERKQMKRTPAYIWSRIARKM